MSGFLLLEDGTRLDGELCGDPRAVTGEVVFNTSMTGYQEAVTDPSYAGQIITFTYPLIGNYGVSAEAMESDRVHARGVIMRDAKNGEDAATAEGGWLDWLRDCGVPAITGVDTRALVRHIRDRGAMRGGIFPAETPRGRGARARRRRALDGRRRPRPHRDPAASRSSSTATARTSSASTPGSSSSIVRQLRERGCRVTLLPCDRLAPRRSSPRTPTSSSSPTAPATPAPSTTSSRTSASWSARSRSSASASATSCSAARSASRPSSCPSATAAPTTRSRTSRPGGSTSPRRTTASRCRGPGGEPQIEGDEPVRWETDFGAAELSHLNLYDRTVEGLVLKDVARLHRPVPPRGRPRPARRPLPLRPLPGACRD